MRHPEHAEELRRFGHHLGHGPDRNREAGGGGVSATGVVNENVPQIAVQLSGDRKFGLDYPASPQEGIYQVIAYVDANGDGKYNIGETRTENNNRYLIYSKSGFLSGITGIQAGWNYAVGLSVTQPERVTDYDLSW